MTGLAADIASVLGSGLVDTIVSLNVIVDADTVVAVDLLTIAANLGIGTLDASQITELTGSLADIESVIASTNITFAPADSEDPSALPVFAITVDETDFVTVDDLNLFAAATSGVITAHVSTGDMATLLTFVPADPDVANNLFFTITDESANAGDLLTLDAKTTIAIDATNVYTFTGTAADLANVLTSDTINHLTVGVTSIVDAGEASASDLFTIDDNSILPVDATAVTTISGAIADIETDIGSDGISFSSSYNVNVTDTGDLGTLITFATNGALTVGSGSGSAVTVNLGASGFSTIYLGGSGDHQITAATTVTETFILDAAQNGGSKINNLTFGDGINIDGGNAITALTGGSQVIGDINTAGEWGFDAITNVLSYYNDSQGQVDSITLTGVTSVELQAGGNLFTIAGGLV